MRNVIVAGNLDISVNTIDDAMNERFVELTLPEIQTLIEESQHAFLPSKERPNDTVSLLMSHFASDPEFRIFGYKIGDDVASYIVVLSDSKRLHSLAIGPMYVAQKHRGRGIGKRQVEHLKEYARERGSTTIFTKTWSKNAASRAIFESLGFKIESVKLNDRSDGDDTINYRLELAA
jgi:GNAT superfamily N-acetyltransferase